MEINKNNENEPYEDEPYEFEDGPDCTSAWGAFFCIVVALLARLVLVITCPVP